MTTEESVTITQTEPDGTVTTIEVTQTKPEDVGEGGESIIEEIVEALFDVSDDAPVDPAAEPTGDEIFTADQFEATAPVDLETEPVTTDPADVQSSEVFVPVDYSVSTEQVPFTTETPDVSLISDTETATTEDAVDPNLQIAQEAQEAANEFAARGDYEAAADAREVAENAAWEAGDQSVLEGSSSTELDSAAHSQDLADYHRDLQEEYTAKGDYQAAQAEADKVVDHTVNADYLGSGEDHSTEARNEEYKLGEAVWEEGNADYYARGAEEYAAQGDFENAAEWAETAGEHQSAADYHAEATVDGSTYDASSQVDSGGTYDATDYASATDYSTYDAGSTDVSAIDTSTTDYSTE